MKAKFIASCVGLPNNGITVKFLDELMDAAKPITREVFVKQVSTEDLNNIARDLGYYVGRGKKGLKLSEDWHVNYYSSRKNGKHFWIMKQSSVEYVFAKVG